MRLKKRKGFTLVELLVVIAILAVLATVSILGYSAFVKKANISNDEAIVSQMNEALMANEALDNKARYCDEAVDQAIEAGFILENLTPSTSGFHFAYDQQYNRFMLLTESHSFEYGDNNHTNDKYRIHVVVGSDTELKAANEEGYSTYIREEFEFDENSKNTITTNKGIDVGKNTNVSTIIYNNSEGTQDVVIRTNGGSLTINDTNAASHQIHYGTLYNADVTTGTSCFSTHGTIYSMKLNAGKAISDENGMVILVEAEKETEIYEQNGGVVIIPSDKTTSDIKADADSKLEKSLTTIGYTVTSTNTTPTADKQNAVMEINNEEELKAFRDSVNNGITYAGVTVKLCSDITLTSAWTPIGLSGYREAFSKNPGTNPKNLYFAGTFDGNNKVISGLTSEGYVPLYKGTNNQYSYGLFGAVSNATIKNLTLDNVYISIKDGDSVGAIVGFSGGDLTVKNCTVNGYVYGYDAVSGVVGRCYKDIKGSLTTINIESNTNNALISIADTSSTARKIAGVLGFASYYNNLNVDGNVNTGNISCYDDDVTGYIAGICLIGGVGDTTPITSAEYNVSIKNNRNEGSIFAKCVSNAAHIACSASNKKYSSVVVKDNDASKGSISVQKYYYFLSGKKTYLTYNLPKYPIVNIAQNLRADNKDYGFLEANNNENILDSNIAITFDAANIPNDAGDYVLFNQVLIYGIAENDVAKYDSGTNTLTLKRDVEFDCDSIRILKDITIDLNGHTITSTNTANYVFHLYGKITLKNGTIKMANNTRALCVGNDCTIDTVNIVTDDNIAYVDLFTSETKVQSIVCTIKNCTKNGSAIVNATGMYIEKDTTGKFAFK